MRIAIFGDVHANIQALDKVLKAIEDQQPDEILCLGDIVGYGVEPNLCIDRVRDATSLILMGNHDMDAANGIQSPGTNAMARLLLDWTHCQLDTASRDFLAALQKRIILPEVAVAVHGCYLNDTGVYGYVTGTMLEKNLRAVAENPLWPKLAFCGHTHVPMCGWIEGDICVEVKLNSPVRWPSKASAVLINPGAVGQPRDGDPRAAFAIVDTNLRTAEVIRVEYDIEVTARAIEGCGLPKILADRLREGR
jgi:diadenosine tetraphosphatase ApaH/serine/threonine PP2A family protein phosphatase